MFGLACTAQAAVQISQVYGGGGNSGAPYNADFVELRNTGSSAVSLSGWSLQYASSSGTTWGGSQLTPLSGAIPAGGFYLVKLATGSNAGAPALPTPDATGSTTMSASQGKVALVSSTTPLSGACPLGHSSIVDFVGFGGANCFEGGGATPALSNTTAALRADEGCTDTNNNAADFSVLAPMPRNSATSVAACGDGGGPSIMAAATYEIQGSGASSLLAGTQVITEGVVTLVTNNGFFIQDLTGDGDTATSDGLFIFTGSTVFPAVAVGNLVSVTGTVVEFNVGASTNADTAARPVTQLTSVAAVTLLGSGYSIVPTAVALPEAVDGDLERYEGMLVTLTGGPFTIAQNFFQGRYGQLTLAVGGRLETPTNRFRPGPLAAALADENARRRILLDDGSTRQNPSPTPYLGADALPRAGDVVTGTITGVIDYGLATNRNTGFGDYKIHPTVMPTFEIANPRTASPTPVGGNLEVASFNVLNYFTTFADGTTADGLTGQGCSLDGDVRAANCRGASNLIEFNRQRAKIVEALAPLDADVIGLMEIQNNGNVGVQNLVDALNARVGAGTYAGVALPPAGTGSDAIRVAMIFKPARISPLGAPLSDTDPVNSRPTLAQPFELPNGERVSLLVSHFKSKGGCPAPGDPDYAGNFDSGDGQGCWNALRLQQAQRLRTFVSAVQTAAGSNDVLLIGDLNAYAQEDPIADLLGAGYVDLVDRFAPGAYSYVFDGAAGRLDHGIASASLSARASGATLWHINADEVALADYNQEFKAPRTCSGAPCPADPYSVSPWRSSDHDPVVVGLSIYKTIVAGRLAGVTGTAGDDIIVSGSGRRTLTGNGGNDIFQFVVGFAGGATITDFSDGDLISLRDVLGSLGVSSSDPIGQRYLTCTARGSDALINVDPDGAGSALPRSLILLEGRNCSVLNATNFIL